MMNGDMEQLKRVEKYKSMIRNVIFGFFEHKYHPIMNCLINNLQNVDGVKDTAIAEQCHLGQKQVREFLAELKKKGMVRSSQKRNLVQPNIHHGHMRQQRQAYWRIDVETFTIVCKWKHAKYLEQLKVNTNEEIKYVCVNPKCPSVNVEIDSLTAVASKNFSSEGLFLCQDCDGKLIGSSERPEEAGSLTEEKKRYISQTRSIVHLLSEVERALKAERQYKELKLKNPDEKQDDDDDPYYVAKNIKTQQQIADKSNVIAEVAPAPGAITIDRSGVSSSSSAPAPKRAKPNDYEKLLRQGQSSALSQRSQVQHQQVPPTHNLLQQPRKWNNGTSQPTPQRISNGVHAPPKKSPAASPPPPPPPPPLPGRQVPGRQAPGRQVPGRQMLGQQAHGRQAPGRQAPGRQAPGRQVPGRQAPGRQAPGRQAPGRQVPGRQVSAQQVPGRQVPGRQVSAQQVPGRQAPTSRLPATAPRVPATRLLPGQQIGTLRRTMNIPPMHGRPAVHPFLSPLSMVTTPIQMGVQPGFPYRQPQFSHSSLATTSQPQFSAASLASTSHRVAAPVPGRQLPQMRLSQPRFRLGIVQSMPTRAPHVPGQQRFQPLAQAPQAAANSQTLTVGGKPYLLSAVEADESLIPKMTDEEYKRYDQLIGGGDGGGIW